MHSADRPLIYYHLIENTNNNVFILIAVKIYFSFGCLCDGKEVYVALIIQLYVGPSYSSYSSV